MYLISLYSIINNHITMCFCLLLHKDALHSMTCMVYIYIANLKYLGIQIFSS